MLKIISDLYQPPFSFFLEYKSNMDGLKKEYQDEPYLEQPCLNLYIFIISYFITSLLALKNLEYLLFLIFVLN